MKSTDLPHLSSCIHVATHEVDMESKGGHINEKERVVMDGVVVHRKREGKIKQETLLEETSQSWPTPGRQAEYDPVPRTQDG